MDRHLQSADIWSLAALNHRHQAAYLGGQALPVSRYNRYATHSISNWQLSATCTRQPTLVDRHLQSADIRSLAALNHRHQAAYLGGQAPPVSRYLVTCSSQPQAPGSLPWWMGTSSQQVSSHWQLSTIGTRQPTLVDRHLQSADIWSLAALNHRHQAAYLGARVPSVSRYLVTGSSQPQAPGSQPWWTGTSSQQISGHWQLSATGTRAPTLVDRHLQSADIWSLAALNHRWSVTAYLGGQAPPVSRYLVTGSSQPQAPGSLPGWTGISSQHIWSLAALNHRHQAANLGGRAPPVSRYLVTGSSKPQAPGNQSWWTGTSRQQISGH